MAQPRSRQKFDDQSNVNPIFSNRNTLFANIFVVHLLIVSKTNSCVSVSVPFGTKNSAFSIFATCTWLYGTIWCALHCHK